VLAGIHIIKEGEGGVVGEVVVVADQGQRVGMTRRDAGRHLHPGVVVGARLRQHRGGRTRRVVLERGRGPVKGHRVGADHLIPEGQRFVASCWCPMEPGHRLRITNRVLVALLL
jgi:hypothetical protein